MKPFDELTRLGKIRQMRPLARTALNAYGLSDARLKFLRQAGNSLFKVNEETPVPIPKAEQDNAGQYLLSIHQPGYQILAQTNGGYFI
jgi:hypothetical protein